MQHRSFWETTAETPPQFPSLDRSIDAETLIIGGGITGIATAYLLHRAGQSVHLIEAGDIGSGDSGQTSGHLSTATDLQYSYLQNSYGQESAQLIAQGMRNSVDQIKRIADTEGIDCHFAYEPGYLYTRHSEQTEELEEEYKAARDAGLKVQLQSSCPLPFEVQRAVRFDNNARFQPLRFLNGLARHLKAESVPIFTHTRAMEVQRDGDYRIVTTDQGHRIRAGQVVMATHLPAFAKAEQTALPPSRTYVMAYKVKGEVPQGLFWDMQSPYHYTRNAEYNGQQVLITGGADHRTGTVRDTDACFRALEDYIREHYPVDKILHRWSGQWYEPTDKLPLIGKSILDERMLISTGYSGDGLVFGMMGARLITDLLQEEENPLLEVVRPRRLHLKSDYIKNNAEVAKHFVKDHLSSYPKELSSIKPGTGRIVQHKGSKYAVYRDESGELTALSPTCTHLGCTVQWNQGERTWDCPCHGGQFSAKGAPLRSPVRTPLKAKPIEALIHKKA